MWRLSFTSISMWNCCRTSRRPAGYWKRRWRIWRRPRSGNSASIRSSRPRTPFPAVAGAWATLQGMGEQGYVTIARQIIELVKAYRRGIEALGLTVIGEPDLSILCFTSNEFDMLRVGEVMAARGFDWWSERMRRTFLNVDMVRMDHFRGFEAYWEVPAGAPTATTGRWAPGPGSALFDALVTPATAGFLRSIEFVTMAVLGGLGSILGGVTGAALLVLLPQVLTVFHDYETIMLGAIMIVFMIFLPAGIVPSLARLAQRRQP